MSSLSYAFGRAAANEAAEGVTVAPGRAQNVAPGASVSFNVTLTALKGGVYESPPALVEYTHGGVTVSARSTSLGGRTEIVSGERHRREQHGSILREGLVFLGAYGVLLLLPGLLWKVWKE